MLIGWFGGHAGTLYWWAGRETAYVVGGTGMVGVATLVWRGLGK